MYRREVLDVQALPKDQRSSTNPFVNGQIKCDIIDLPAYRYIGWNSQRPVFRDARVRQAMTHALNREAIIKDVFVGMGAIPTGPFLPGSPGLDPEIKPLPFDLAKAAELLSQAGWIDSDNDGLRDQVIDGKKLNFEFSLMIYATNPEFAALAAIFKEDLLKIGIKMTVEAAEWSLWQKRTHEKDFDAFTGGWTMGWVTDPYQLWHSSQADAPEGSNYTGFRNKEADGLIEGLRETFEPQEREKMLRRIHRLIVDSYNYTFLITERRPFCYHKELKGLVYSKLRPVEHSLPWWIEAN
jgi:ABC-type transport system substrate-binding protein